MAAPVKYAERVACFKAQHVSDVMRFPARQLAAAMRGDFLRKVYTRQRLGVRHGLAIMPQGAKRFALRTRAMIEHSPPKTNLAARIQAE
jgi:hypothetical protein